MPKILVVIPAYNESKKISNVINKINLHCKGIIDEICVIDDCSFDNTYESALIAGAKVIRHNCNLGVGAAIRTGLYYGYENSFDIAVVISGDDQHNPEEMKTLIDPILLEDYDFIQGSRYMNSGKTINQPLLRSIFTRLYPLIFNILTNTKCTDVTNGYRAMKIKKILNDTKIDINQKWLNRYELEVYLLYNVYLSSYYSKKEVPITITYHKEKTDYSKMKMIIDWWRILRPIIFLKFNIKK